MTAARQIRPTHAPELCTGTVALGPRMPSEPWGPRFSIVADDGRELVATRASSCLLAPEPGDRVLIALTPEPFVLAVLRRDDEAPARVIFEGDARLEAPLGRLDLGAAEGVAITAGEALSLFAAKLSVKAGVSELFTESVSLVARTARSHVDKLSLVADRYDVAVERITERASRVYRFVSELDQLRARHFDHRAEHSAQIVADNTTVNARRVVKMDGEQVHIG